MPESVTHLVELWDTEPLPDVVIVRRFYTDGRKPTEHRYLRWNDVPDERDTTAFIEANLKPVVIPDTFGPDD